MDKSKNPTTAKRREFLKFASVGAASGAAAAALGTPSPAEAETQSDTAAGYRETAHVKQAYELARF
ncbi:MAG: twin-arginine translocation signal domain-containing protein [Alphaproteobacteria bacterium]|nr:twin-arginine translocation signal domain-containing protein [Alphaproteobacteria bacterium]